MTDTMTVTVRDRSAEPPWGYGRPSPITRKVTIATTCAHCGARRGTPTGFNQHDDGEWYWVQVWMNPCGHQDSYPSVIAEARALEATHTPQETRP